MITGLIKPDQGEFDVGSTVKIGYMEQMRDALDDNKTVFETISSGHDMINLGKMEVQARSYVAQFNFTGSSQEKNSESYREERKPRTTALLLKQGSNLLLLDEPSNDLISILCKLSSKHCLLCWMRCCY